MCLCVELLELTKTNKTFPKSNDFQSGLQYTGIMYGHFASCCHGTRSGLSGWTCFSLPSVSVGGNGLQALIIVLICLIVDKTEPKNNNVCFRHLRREQGYQKKKEDYFWRLNFISDLS